MPMVQLNAPAGAGVEVGVGAKVATRVCVCVSVIGENIGFFHQRQEISRVSC